MLFVGTTDPVNELISSTSAPRKRVRGKKNQTREKKREKKLVLPLVFIIFEMRTLILKYTPLKLYYTISFAHSRNKTNAIILSYFQKDIPSTGKMVIERFV